MYLYMFTITETKDFAGGPVVRSPPSSAGDLGVIPGRGTKVPPAEVVTGLRCHSQKPSRLNKYPASHNQDPRQPKTNHFKNIRD